MKTKNISPNTKSKALKIHISTGKKFELLLLCCKHQIIHFNRFFSQISPAFFNIKTTKYCLFDKKVRLETYFIYKI